MDKNMSYIFGLFQTDGHLSEQTQNRGRFSIELDIKDEDIINKLKEIITENSYISYRKRETNFGQSKTAKLSVYDWKFREMIKSYGFPVGKKSDEIAPPSIDYIEVDYIRGLIDGDGSIGMTSSGFPIFGFTTKSETLKKYMLNFIYKHTGKRKKINKNKRDGCYNICLYKEDAIKITNVLYYDEALSIKRKYNNAKLISKWKRPANMKKIVGRKFWTPEEDNFILNHSINESVEKLQRSRKSVSVRLCRLRKI